MKTWVYVEGDAEEILVKQLLCRHFPNVDVESDIKKFLETDSSNLAYIQNCGGICKLPHDIKQEAGRIAAFDVRKIIVVGDLERLPCYTSRKVEVLQVLGGIVNTQLLVHVYFKPMIERIYWTRPDLIAGVLNKQYREKYSQDLGLVSSNLPGAVHHNYLWELKSLFKSKRVKYRESAFASEFFPDFDFDTSIEPSVQRLWAATTEAFA